MVHYGSQPSDLHPSTSHTPGQAPIYDAHDGHSQDNGDDNKSKSIVHYGRITQRLSMQHKTPKKLEQVGYSPIAFLSLIFIQNLTA
jgi:hypothetical protein